METGQAEEEEEEKLIPPQLEFACSFFVFLFFCGKLDQGFCFKHWPDVLHPAPF